MNAEDIRAYCIAKKGLTESFPFGGDVLVFKVMEKMFALLPLESRPLRINLKMDEEIISEYRERFEGVKEGWHMSKKHWNTVLAEDSDVNAKELKWMIDHSYEMVVKKLKKTEREALSSM